MSFDPNEHITKLPQGKDRTAEYLEVKWRLVWFRSECDGGTITTELLTLDLDREMTAEVSAWNDQTKRKEKVQKTAKGWCLFRATVTDGKGGSATAHGSESAVDFADYIEKAETKAVGRALAYLGYGTQFAPELSEEHRIVDAPVEDKPAPQPAKREQVPTPTPTEVPSVDDLHKQCNALFGVGYWQTMLHKALKFDSMDVPIREDDLTHDDRIRAKKYMDFVAKSQRKSA